MIVEREFMMLQQIVRKVLDSLARDILHASTDAANGVVVMFGGLAVHIRGLAAGVCARTGLTACLEVF